MNKHIVRGLAAVGALVTVGAANAAVDVTEIEAAGVDAAVVAAAIFAVMVAIWASKIAYRKFFGS